MPERQSVETSQPEHKEHEPKINYHFLYSAHRTAEDFSNLEEAFKKADIYIPEVAGWTQEVLENVQAVSDGKILPEQLKKNKNSAWFQELKVMHGSRKPILFVDVSSKDEEILKRKERADKENERAFEFFINGRFFESLKLMRVYAENFTDLQLERENKIKENLDKYIKNFLENNPDYSNKELNVLVSLGSAHTSLYHQLRGEGRSVSREFNKPLIVYSSLMEARTGRQFLNKTIDDKFFARDLLENLFEESLLSVTNDTNKLFRVLRKLSGKLSLKDIQEISEKAGKNGGKIDVVQELEARGIKVPKTEEEMDKMLGLNKNEK